MPLDTAAAAAGGTAAAGTGEGGKGSAVGEAVFYSYDDLQQDLQLGTEEAVGSTVHTYHSSTSSRSSSSSTANQAASTGAAAASARETDTERSSSGSRGSQPSGSRSTAGAAEAAEAGGTSVQLAMLCFEDVIHSGVPLAVQQLKSGDWGSSWWGSGRDPGLKDVIMLTGKILFFFGICLLTVACKSLFFFGIMVTAFCWW
jgi:hypothetical protein